MLRLGNNSVKTTICSVDENDNNGYSDNKQSWYDIVTINNHKMYGDKDNTIHCSTVLVTLRKKAILRLNLQPKNRMARSCFRLALNLQ